MSDSVGDIYAKLALDMAPYEAGLNRAKGMGDEISGKSINVKIASNLTDVESEFNKFLFAGARRKYIEVEVKPVGDFIDSKSVNISRRSMQDMVSGAGQFDDKLRTSARGANMLAQGLGASDSKLSGMVSGANYLLGSLNGVNATLLRMVGITGLAVGIFMVLEAIAKKVFYPNDKLSKDDEDFIKRGENARNAREKRDAALSSAGDKEESAAKAQDDLYLSRITSTDRLMILEARRVDAAKELIEAERELQAMRARGEMEVSQKMADQRVKVADARNRSVGLEASVDAERKSISLESYRNTFSSIEGQKTTGDKLNAIDAARAGLQRELSPAQAKAQLGATDETRAIGRAEVDVIQERIDALDKLKAKVEETGRAELDNLAKQKSGIESNLYWEQEAQKEKMNQVNFSFTDAAGLNRAMQTASGKSTEMSVGERRAEEQRAEQVALLTGINEKIGAAETALNGGSVVPPEGAGPIEPATVKLGGDDDLIQEAKKAKDQRADQLTALRDIEEAVGRITVFA